ncbi:MAG: hypothetical protein BGO09_04530 [Bacteroidetes bacterium 47-18]|nr:MAG: hypothetical protein BGO09_04530 [Bacteroidetes bacterium 47-18]
MNYLKNKNLIMGHSPKLQTAIDKSAEAKRLIEEEIRKAQEALANTEAKATDYINTHTKGIIQVLASNNNAYSKFTDDYSLKVLDGVIDGVSKTAKDLVTNKDDKEKMAEAAIGDIAEVVKSTLALFSTSSSTNQTSQIVFSYIISGDNNFAVYFACNSMSVENKSAFGEQKMVVVSNMYLLASVKPNPDITKAKIIQNDLDTLYELNKSFNEALINVKTIEDLENLKLAQIKIDMIVEKLKKDLEKEVKRELLARLEK